MSSIGQTLSKARESKKLSLQAVSECTKIHLKVLKALEEDDFDSLPGVLYVKSFLKKYSEFLGLESNEIIKDYLELRPQEPAQILAIESKEKKFPRLRLKTIIIILGGCLSIYLFFLIIRPFLSSQSKTVSQEVTRIENVPRTKSGAYLQGAAKTDILLLRILAKRDTWIELKADGHIVFQHTLESGREESWRAKDNFELSVSEAGNVVLSLNGRPLGKLGYGVKRGILINHKGLSLKR